MSVNKAIILGRVGKDPEIKSFQSGDKIANFSIATSEKWTDKTSGEKKEKTEWHNVVIKNDAIVRVVENYVKKGSLIYIEGQIQTRKWQDQLGTDRYTTEIVVGKFNGVLSLLGGKPDTAPQTDAGHSEPAATVAQQIDDEIPF